MGNPRRIHDQHQGRHGLAKMTGRLLLMGLLVVQLARPIQSIEWTLPDVIDSIGSVSTSIIDPSLLPTPQGLLDGSKQLIAGYPFEYVSSTLNFICSQALSSHKIKSKFTPDINKMNFQLQGACTKTNFALTDAESMWKSPEFNPKKKVVILATGWTTTVNGSDTIDVLSKAYNCRGDVNFVAVDAARFVDTLYTWSAFNTEEIGENIAHGLVHLLDLVPVENIHLIGHSLGAHIVGSAGRHLQRLTGKTIPRITGLDPAKPCFNEGEILSGLLRGDAAFIDVIHSNPGVLGKKDPLGDADFYPGGIHPLPEGCYSVVCAHARAWQYYAESVFPGNEHNFMATRCNSMQRLRDLRCPGNEHPMGYAAPTTIRGNYFLEVSGTSPYGKHANIVRTMSHEHCGVCPNGPDSTTTPTSTPSQS
ncbi:vitellogenin-3 [Drosophila pseudoobscura]|uniref:Vitellogenin-3 n=1 Tax=Drosophila pseudoobscura pseudoobscura TaxID=46245 RepID=Q29HU2_DROPS|nr:vitellogenin-3 [Drosophila pseudoobscura]